MVLVTNAIAILSEDRFLARIGWSSSAASEPAFGTGAAGEASVKSKMINLIASVRTLMRSEWLICYLYAQSDVDDLVGGRQLTDKVLMRTI